MAETVNVTQAIRDFVTDWFRDAGIVTSALERIRIREGKRDEDLLLQRIAAWDAEATRQAQADRAELVEAYSKLRRITVEHLKDHPDIERTRRLMELPPSLAKHGGRDAGTDNAG